MMRPRSLQRSADVSFARRWKAVTKPILVGAVGHEWGETCQEEVQMRYAEKVHDHTSRVEIRLPGKAQARRGAAQGFDVREEVFVSIIEELADDDCVARAGITYVLLAHPFDSATANSISSTMRLNMAEKYSATCAKEYKSLHTASTADADTATTTTGCEGSPQATGDVTMTCTISDICLNISWMAINLPAKATVPLTSGEGIREKGFMMRSGMFFVHLFDSASVNIISSMPSLMYRRRNALRLNMNIAVKHALR